MPSPIAHIAAGAVVASFFSRSLDNSVQRRCIWACVIFFSLAPDLDVVPGFFAGNIALYHNQISHGLFFGITVCLLATGIFWMFLRWFLDWWSYPRVTSIAFASYGLHLILDTASLGPGVKLFWPFTDESFSAPVTIFYGVRHSEGLFSAHHLITIGNEVAIIIFFLLLIRFFSRLRRRTHGSFSVNT